MISIGEEEFLFSIDLRHFISSFKNTEKKKF